MIAPTLSPTQRALVELGLALRDAGYGFTTITPASHARVAAREPASSPTLRDVFGWSRPFDANALPARMLAQLDAAEALDRSGIRLRSKVRFSTLDDALYVHSSYPTDQRDSVFFGPDSYRFVRLLRERVTTARTVIDVGAGSGVGGLSLADRVERIVLTDISKHALSFAAVNAELAGVRERVVLVKADVLRGVGEDADAIVSNPPYLVDSAKRSYRDGGHLGIELPVRIAREGLTRLSGKGQMVLYSGAPVRDGVDLLRSELLALAPAARYDELDPDVFGEELASEAYAAIDRIAAVAFHVER